MLKEFGIKNIIIAIFVFGAVIALLVFSGLIKVGDNSKEASGKVTVWGTIPFATIQPYIDQSRTKNIDIMYKKQDPLTYESDLINAFAAGVGPDLFIMPHEDILRHVDKIFEISYASFPKDQYLNTYINESELFTTKNGILAIPMSVDPMVMYYNKQLISSAFLIDVPQYWEDTIPFVSEITIADANGSITRSGAALGSYDNILNAKAILSTLFLQNGNTIVGTNKTTTKKRAEFAVTEQSFAKAEQALNFFTSFSRIGNQNYSWNEALDFSRESFIAGDLALYFGKMSEVEYIAQKNPNLNFDVALMPQISETSIKSTFGSMTGIAIAKQSKNVAAAMAIASKLAGKEVSEKLTRDLLVAPARKDLLRNKPDDALLTMFFNSAIIADGWIDPDSEATEILFKNLIRSVNTGSLNTTDALRRANADLEILLNRTINTTITDESVEI